MTLSKLSSTLPTVAATIVLLGAATTALAVVVTNVAAAPADPEPGTTALVLAGVGVAGFLGRRRGQV